MKSPTYIIPGAPIPQPRARILRNGFSYDPVAQDKECAREELIEQRDANYQKIITHPVALDITFFMPIPKSLSKKKQDLLLDQYHTIRPDLDNLIKFTLDTFSKSILILDDSLIYSINSKKIYSFRPKTEFFFIYGESENE